MGFDNRQIQTAVLADPESDEPVVCPTDSIELEAFREEFSGTTFWCGVLLGGCGGQLTTRRGNVRVSHFAHFPDPEALLPPCGRRSHGVASADHLYVRAATQAWLRSQGHTPRYRYIDRDDIPIGSLVEIEVGGHTLRLHMDRTTAPDWDAVDTGDVILGPGVRIDQLTLVRRRYVNRVKFVSEGTKRVMVLGTELPRVGTDWDFDLADCTITEDGRLITPVVAQLQAERPVLAAAPDTVSAPSSPAGETLAASQRPSSERVEIPVQIGALVRRISTAVREKETAAVRQLRDEAELQISRCEGQALEHLQGAIQHANAWLSHQDRIRRLLIDQVNEAVQRGYDFEVRHLVPQVREILRHDEDPTQEESTILNAADTLLQEMRRRAGRPQRPSPPVRQRTKPTRAEKAARRTALPQARSLIGRLRVKGLPTAEEKQLIEDLVPLAEAAGDLLSVAERHDVDEWGKKLADPTQWPPADEKAAAAAESEPNSSAVPAGTPARLVPVAAAVRGALKRAARERTTTSWKRLEEQLGSALPRLNNSERVQVLIQVDRATAGDEPLLSSLLAAGDPHFAHQYYRRVVAVIGLEAPDDDEDLRDVIEADVERVFSDWRFR
ncbi:hypothetical protein ACFRR7_34670 [Streptomyces sp. NPDC056909]|uniref:hypothetical protein n=1 Tax=Streptomyces sp. NPDC056909 TaxID=3345963 RepID=UPI003681C0BC